MISSDPGTLLFIEPREGAARTPVIDAITRRMTAALRRARRPDFAFCGVHKCICGAQSKSFNYILESGETTNSLCVHYLAHHREEVPAEQLRRVLQLPDREEEPSSDEVQGPETSVKHGDATRPGRPRGWERVLQRLLPWRRAPRP